MTNKNNIRNNNYLQRSLLYMLNNFTLNFVDIV